MKKSDIFSAVVLLRSDKPQKEREILKQLSSTLQHLSTDLDKWDERIDPALGAQITTKIGSTKQDLSLEQIIRDIDIMMNRAS